MPDLELRIPLGAMLPEAMEHGNPGLVAVRGLNPWPTGGWRPYSYFAKTATNLGGQVYGGHYHVWGSVWEAYVARANGANVGITRVTLQTGSPPGTLALGSTLDVTGTPWSSQALVAHGYQFISFGQHVLVAGNETLQMQARDSTGGSAFADAIPAGSIDRPSGRFIANAGLRVVIAYVRHNDATSQANYGSPAQLDEVMVAFSGLKSGYSYWSTKNTATGDNDWDPEELAEAYRLIDGLGVITGLATSAHGFGWVWKEHGLYRMDYQQSPADFRLISAEHGTRSPQSIVVVEDTAYWVDQHGHVCRAGGSGGVEDLSSASLMTPLLEEDAVFLGRYPENDLTQGKNTAVATAFTYGATERFQASMDVETIFSPTRTVYRYPQGFYDASSGTVRWIYPGTHNRMSGGGTVASGQTAFSWASGTLFDDSANSFMDGRTITIDGSFVTTVSSVTTREALVLAGASPSNFTNAYWEILFQRWLEFVFQPGSNAFGVTDVTHAWNKTAGQRPWAMHWGISAPGFGLRLAQVADVPQRLAYAPQGVLYAFTYLQSGGADFYSLTYGWPYGTVGGVDQAGYLLLEDPQFVTSYIGIPSQDGGESAISSRPVAIRAVYSSRQRAHDLGLDVTLNVVVLTKARAGQNPRVSNIMSFNMDQASPPGDARGWISLDATVEGQWHQLVIWFSPDPFTDNDPGNAFEILSSIDYFEVKLTPGAM